MQIKCHFSLALTGVVEQFAFRSEQNIFSVLDESKKCVILYLHSLVTLQRSCM